MPSLSHADRAASTRHLFHSHTITCFLFLLALTSIAFVGCGGGGSSAPPPPPPPAPPAPTITSVSVSCAAPTAPVNQTNQCTATVQGTGSFSSNVNWSVNNVSGGNSTVGTVTASGLYTAPATVPTPFTISVTATSAADSTKSASASIIVAGTIASVQQTISAANGGTIALPDGSSVTIAPGFLNQDEIVTLSEVSVPPTQPPNPAITSVGATLAMSFAIPVQMAPALVSSTRSQVLVPAGSQGTASPALQFSLGVASYDQSLLQNVGSSAPFANFTDSSGASSFIGLVGGFVSAGKAFVGSTESQLLTGLSATRAAIQSVAFGAANLANGIVHFFQTPTRLSFSAATSQWQRNLNWSSSDCPSGTTLVLVHGMLSSVEDSFPPSVVGEIETAFSMHYQSVVGFDYNWLQSIDQSGAQLAGFLNDLATACNSVTSLDIEAHSEGVPVSMSALTQSSAVVSHLISLGGPIMGTPAANDTSVLQTIILAWNGLDLSVGALDLASILTSPFITDLQTDSATLSAIRSNLSSRSAKNTPQFILAGGDNPLVRPPIGPALSLGFLSPVMGQNFDGVVPWTSALGFGSGLRAYPLVYPLQLFEGLGHNDLVSSPQVQAAIGHQIQAVTFPSLSCTSSVSSCEGAQGTTFNFSGQGYSADSTVIRIFRQDSRGSVTQTSPALQDSGGDVSWSTTPTCTDAAGSFSIIPFDTGENLASNDVMQTIDPNCSSTVTLTVASSNPASGATISVSPADTAGLSGGTTQFALTYTSGTIVTLTASPIAAGNSFSNWTGCDTTSTTTCTVTMTASRTVTASYVPPVPVTHALTVGSSNPNSAVPITANPADTTGQSGGTTQFTLTFDNGTVVALSAPSTANGNDFSSWVGCDSTSGTTCTVTMSADRTVTADYVPPGTATLTVSSTDPSSGATITASPADNAGSGGGTTPLTLTYNIGTAVILTPSATANGNSFTAWSGCDSVSGSTCAVTLTANRSVTANYGRVPAFAYVANQNSGDVSAYSVDATTGALTSVGTFTSGLAPASVAADPAGHCLYVANSQDSVTPIAVFSINQSTGALTPGQGPGFSASEALPMSIAMHPSGKFAYAANFSGTVSAFAVDANTCALTRVSGSPYAAGTLPQFATVDPSGVSLYVGNLGDNDISGYKIDQTTGALTPIAGSPFPAGSLPTSLTVHPSGKFAFETSSDSTVLVYTRDTLTGALTQVSSGAIGGASFSSATDLTGTFLFVPYGSGTPDNIQIFTVNAATGALAPASLSAAGTMPLFVALDPSGEFLYVANNGSTSVSAFRIDPNSGSLSSVGTAPAGGGPISLVVTSKPPGP